MRKFLKAFSLALVAAGLLATPAIAQAQEVTLRVEPGVAIPSTDPQAQRFGVGAALAVKPELTLGHYLGLGPSLQVMQLPSNVSGVDAGNAWSYGGFVRVKRPHDHAHNPGHGLSAISPWIDADLKLVHTDPLDRLGAAVAVGAQVPTSDSRRLWVGPFARYDAVNQEDGKTRVNTNSAKTFIVGLSFEFGAPSKRPEPAQPVAQKPVPPPPPPPPAEEKKPLPPPTEVVRMEFKPRVQFAWDSAKLEATQLPLLQDVVKAMLADKSYKVHIDGHASSEGQVEHNNKLSAKRAQSVADFLVANGIARDRLTVSGFGSKKPVADNKTEAGRIANRRVEFDVTFVLVKEGK
jgi:OOP family OmpA-OmpF porin